MIGRTLAHYRVLDKLGEGGMGEVYRATDTKLGRDVALKVLPAAMAGDPERLARFEREARAVAALNHPHIVTLHSVEDADGVRFLTMELVEGQSLDQVIPTSGLPVDRILEIAGAIAAALAAAHEKGIVHRDLKPANVMVTYDGRVKVLDFGLAKEVRAAEATDATFTSAGRTAMGVVMGTPAYMAPEQIAGRAVDHRTDIFALGILLYEMATGRRPFAGASSAELASAILRDTPVAVTEVRTELPADLARIIRRCLEKDPHDRLQTARDVAIELRDLGKHPSGPPTSAARPSPTASAPDSGAAREDEGFWVAVLPFTHRGADPSIEAVSEGLTEEIVTGLSRFSYLRVIARGSTRRYAGESVDVRAVGRQLGAGYVMEGSVRQAGSRLRVAAQLVDAHSGAHLWAETYDRPLMPETLFEVQDDLVPRIVSTVADMHGVLRHSLSDAVRSRPAADLTSHEAALRGFGYYERQNASEHAEVRAILERAIGHDPGSSDCWAMLSLMYGEEYKYGFNALPDPLERALDAARRAVDAAPASNIAQYALASALFFRREIQAFRNAADRAISLNPLDSHTTAFMGMLLAYGGDWERGCALVARASELNPHHPRWYWMAPFANAYRKGDDRTALDAASRINLPGYLLAQAALTAVHGQLGDLISGRDAVRSLLALDPNFAAVAREVLGKWWDAELVDRVIEGLRKAGLDLSTSGPANLPVTAGAPPSTDSGAAGRDEGFRVAVLPFTHRGADASVEALAEGLTEEIVTGLSRFSYLRVLASNATARYAGNAVDAPAAGRELGARYVMEGNIRQAGARLRIAVRLVDTTSGAHLWAETYERPCDPATVFELQDELVPRIVSSVADWYGALPRSMSEAVRLRDADQLSPYEAVLRSFGYYERVSPDEHATVRAALERAVQQAPGSADAWAMLSMMYGEEFRFGFNEQPDSLGRALEAARRAADAAPSNHFAFLALAQALFFRKERDTFRSAAERAIALNPMDGSTVEYIGHLIGFSGDWERGCEIAERARQLNPRHPAWYWAIFFLDAYRKADYIGARDFARKMNMPAGLALAHALFAALYGQLGDRDAARTDLGALLALKPGYALVAQTEFSKWYPADLVAALMDGLRKAGLDVRETPEAATRATATGDAPSSGSGATRQDEGFWVAVLPFKCSGGSADLAALGEGLTEEIVTGLSRFSYLRVLARGSRLGSAKDGLDTRSSGRATEARYVMEGSLRQAGTKLRIGVQLVDTTTGAHLWAEQYERTFSSDASFELQDDLVPRIVSTVADLYGVLPRSMSEALRSRAPDLLSPYEAVLRSFSYFERVTAEELAAARSALELAVRKTPAYADAWAMLALLCAQEYGQGFSLLPDSLASGAAAARRAVEAGPSNHLAHFSLAQVLFFQKEFRAFRNAATRAAELNPMDGNSIAFLGEMLTYSGDVERGLALAGRAKQLNPNHPGWYWYTDFFHAYRQRDYAAALGFVLRANLPGHWGEHVAIAAACGQLGDHEMAGKALRTLLTLRPDFANVARTEFEKWWDPAFAEHLIDGLRKAGLDVPSPPGSGVSVTRTDESQRSGSGATRVDEGFWVAVLPFTHRGADVSLDSLAEGLTDEIVTGLSRFSYLRVIARASTRRYAGEAVDIRAVGRELGARYVMEGSLRQAGTKLRLGVQLVDTTTGAHLWAENYERAFSPDAVFELQDDLVPRIVSTVADMHGVLVHSMSEALRSRSSDELSPDEALLRSFGIDERLNDEEHALVREILERAVEKAPAHGDCWARLAHIYATEHMNGHNPRPDPLGRALSAARRAVDIAPSHHLAHYALAEALFFRREIQPFRNAAERAIALNPMDGSSTAFMGILLAYAGDWERGCALVQRAAELTPHHPGWFWFPAFYDAYRKGEYVRALDVAVKINMPGYYFSNVVLGAAYGQLGDERAGREAVRALLASKPDFATSAREELGKWHDPALVEQVLDGLRKAGLPSS